MRTLLRKYINDIHLSLAFTVLFTAYNTQTHIQKTMTISIKQDNPEYSADGYVCFGIIYTFFSLGMFITPPLMSILGLKTSLVFGAFCYLPFVTCTYFEMGWVMNVGAAVSGFGASLLWTSQAVYTVLNSKVGSTHSGIGVFWIFYQVSLFTGNSFVYYLFKNSDQFINQHLRRKISIILGGVVLCSVLMLYTLGRPMRQGEAEKIRKTVLGEVKATFLVLRSKYMLNSICIFIFCGLQLTFFSVFAASLGFTKYLSANSKEFAPLSGVMQGVGEIIGCIFAQFMIKRSFLGLRLTPAGCILSFIAYIMVFIGLPDASVFTYTIEKPLVELPISFFLLANVFCGFGDACVHIEMYTFIGYLYPNESGPAFAMFKFFRCFSLATSFYCSNYVGLRIQTVVLMISSLFAIISYYFSVGKLFSFIENESEKTSDIKIETS